MLTVRDHGFGPIRSRFDRALQRVPQAEVQARRVGLDHLHSELTEAAMDAGFGPEAVGVDWDAGHVGITQTPEGDRLADHEYGHPRSDTGFPHATLRTRASEAHSEANRRYAETLWRGVGF